jgi:recombination protein RecT
MGNPTYEKVKGWLESEGIREMIGTSLGKAQEVDAWVNGALASIGTDKEILDAKPESILGAVLEAATLGLRFEGPLGEAYLATRSKKEGKDQRTGKGIWITEAQLQIGYRGLMKLARRDPRVRKIEAIIVHENDRFEHQLGSTPFLNHTWDVTKPRGRMVAVYAGVRYNDGFYDFGQPYSMDAVMKHRDNILADKRIRVAADSDGREKFFKVWDDGEKEMSPDQVRRIPWINYIEAMVQKTAVRWSAKFWDLTPDFDRAAALISLDESGRSQQLEDLARRILPDAVLNRTHEAGSDPAAGQRPTSDAQGASLTRMGSLRDQMLREAGIRKVDAQDGPPAEGAPEAVGEPEPATPEPVDAAGHDPVEMSDEEKAEALRLEQEEAAAFEAEKQRLLDQAEEVRRSQNRGGRRGTNGAR